MKKYQQLLGEAYSYQNEANALLSFALLSVLQSKGLSEDVIHNFSVSFANGNENVVHYKANWFDDGLDIEKLSVLSKKEILERISKF